MFLDVESLKFWFENEKRNLPWREKRSPYAVWISEIMLQQTQAQVVIPYFEKWMQQFPTISHLAEAKENEVVKAWEGLGYYSRARNLHSAAKWLYQYHDGALPQSEEELIQIKGIGPYTTAAILSFAFHKKAAAVDGNVARVLSRLFLINEDVTKSTTLKDLRAMTLKLLPDHQPWVIMEALIELGATICTKKPVCDICPLQESCLAFKHAMAEKLPNRGKSMQYVSLMRYVAVIRRENHFLVRQGKKGEVMEGLYEFPYFEFQRQSKQKWREFLQDTFGFSCVFQKSFAKVKHTFTRYRVALVSALWMAAEEKEILGYNWVSLAEIKTLPFSAGHRRILLNLGEK